MEELARVYSDALFAAANAEGKVDLVREELADVCEALDGNRELTVFFFSPHFTSREKKEGIDRVLVGADDLVVNFLKVLVDGHRMPVIFRIQRQFEELWRDENRMIEVEVTSAVDLDDEVVAQIKQRIESQTGRTVELQRRVDEGILGGLVVRVSNMILDASIRNQLERLRRQVAKAT
jgi:F-type H+-transporting ATPase subunit delta